MKKNLTFLILMLCTVSQMYAVVARPKPSGYQQPDGSVLESRLQGDEYFHFRKTADNYVLLPNAAGYMVYAVKDANGELVPSAVVAHNIAERTAEEKMFLKSLQPNLAFGSQVRAGVIAKKMKHAAARKTQVVMRSGVPQTGATRFLVILVNFSDNVFKIATPQVRYNEQFNGASYTTDGATGSVKKYFEDNSNKSFSPQFDVFGPVTMSKTMAYYGGNDANGNDLHPEEMVFEACQLLDSQIDFSLYDANNDGVVDNVYVIYAGYGEASGAAANTIWPHQWEVTNTTKLDGKAIGSYSCSNELQGTSGTVIDGVGTACHEFSHAVGLPDLYDTDYDTNGQSADVDTWSLMASGCYNNNGMTPPYYNAVERELTGWGTPTEISTPANLTLKSIDQNQFYKITTKTANEYYLVENRQLTGWDTYLYAHGMIVYHVDKTSTYASRWTDNTINAYSVHNCVDVVEADGAAVYFDGSNQTAWESSVLGDPFPGSKSVKSLTDATTPNMKSWAGVATGKPITEITEANNLISFKFMGGESAFGSFTALDASNVTPTSFTANWSAATGATKYLLNVYKKTTTGGGAPVTALSENFDKFTLGTTGATPNSTDVASSMDTYTQTTGWVGVKVYQAGGAIKLGSSSSLGSLTTPSIDLSGNGGSFNVSFKSMAWSGDATSLKIYLNDVLVKTVTGLTNDANYTLSPFSVDITGGTAASKIRFEGASATKGRFFLEDVVIVSGQGSTTTVTSVLKDTEVTSGTSYDVTGLEENGTYYYTVKAGNATTTSAESNEVTVSLATGINRSIADSYAVRVNGRNVTIVTPVDEVVRVFDASGRMVRQEKVAAGTTQMTLAAGQMYIVRVGSVCSSKIVIR